MPSVAIGGGTWVAVLLTTTSAAVGMGCGAFGSHGLRSRNPPLSERSISNWSTASSYLIYNGLALLAISFHPSLVLSRRARIATGAITGGALVFSGSIMGLVLGKEGWRKVLGPMTPIGGMAMIGG